MITERSRQDGNVLIAVMVAMVVLMTMGAGMVNYFVYSEADAVERTLAEYRAYWAMMGTVNYMLSRAEGQGVCGTGGKDTGDVDSGNSNRDDPCADESARIDSLTKNITDTPALSSTWTFPLNNSVGSNYKFDIDHAITTRSSEASYQDGQLKIDLTVENLGNASVLNHLTDRSQGVRVGFCITDHGWDAITPKADNTATPDCGVPPVIVNNTVYEGRSKIQFIRRLPPS